MICCIHFHQAFIETTADQLSLVSQVPYVGQGAQMGIEDAGTLVLLMKMLCMEADGKTLNLSRFPKATALYEELRIPRSSTVLDCSKSLGQRQILRAQKECNEMAELMIRGEVMVNDTLSEMLPGATFDYAAEVQCAVTRANGAESKKSNALDINEVNLAMEALWGGRNPFC
jgi:hypothetical protein